MPFNFIKRQKNTFGTVLLLSAVFSAVCFIGASKTAAADPLTTAQTLQMPSLLLEETPANSPFSTVSNVEQATEQSIDSQAIEPLEHVYQSPEQLVLEQSIEQGWDEQVYQPVSERDRFVYNESAALLTQADRVEIDRVENAAPKFAQAGKQRWYVQGGLGADLDDDLFGLVGAGVSHFFYDGHSINLELNGLAVDQQGDDAVGLNLALLVRSHWIRRENWSIYIDGGAGLLTTTNDVPNAGSSFNFTPQIGGGATFAVNDTQRIMTGLRWYHISNAGTFESNPGLDTLYGYVGYNFPF